MQNRKSKVALAILLAIGAVPLSGVQAEESQQAEKVEKIAVTGSRIQRTSAQMTTPTTVIDSETIEMSGVKNIGDLLNQMPALLEGIGGATINDNNNTGTANLNQAGMELANLRGLGTVRTLVLVNGRRHVAGSAGQSSVDLAMIPTALVDRVEIITGGASAIYGADAVTGVVNFILKRDFEGFKVDLSSGQTSRSDGKTKDVSFTFGQGFDDEKGNITAHFTYSDREELAMTSRNYANKSPSFIANPANTGPNDGIADTVFAEDVRYQALSEEGLFYVPNENFVLNDTDFDIINNPGNFPPTFADDPFGLGYDTFSIDRDNGQFRPFQAGINCSVVPCDGGDGFRTAETNTLIVPSERYLFDVSGHYDISDDFRLFASGKYAKVESAASGQASVFHDDNFGPLIAIKSDNPFRPQGLVDVMDERGLDTVALAVVGLSSRALTKRETSQFTVGGEGYFGDYDYEFYVQHGRVKSNIRTQDVLNERYYEALDAVADESGNAVCRSGNPECVAFNPINNLASQAALDYVSASLLQTDEIKQTVASFSLNGDWFDTSAGTAAFAVGAEYRKETSKSDPDLLAQAVDADGVGSGLVGSRTGPSRAENTYLKPVNGSYNVAELFGETIIPLLADVTAVDALDLELAARYSDHSVTGGDATYKSALNWSLNDWFRTRVTYSHAVRAPNIQELFAPNSIGGQRVTDPCHVSNLEQGRNPANRQANCAALGLAPDFQSEASFGTRNVTTQGNVDLEPEKADTITVGFVFTPMRQLSVAIDYWDVEIEDAITSFNPTDVLDNCVDNEGLNQAFCGLVTRDSGGQINNISVQNINAASFSGRGVDLDLNYGHEFSNSTLGFTFQGTYLDERQFQQNAEDPNSAPNLAGQVRFPRFRALIRTMYNISDFTASWTVNYVGESTFNKSAQPEAYPDWFDNKVGAYTNHNLRFNYSLSDTVNFYLGVNNVADKKPENLPGVNSGSMLYDAIGRRYSAGVNISM